MPSDTPQPPPTTDPNRSGKRERGDSDPSRKTIARIGRYEVVHHLATGGMGAVYRAHDTEENREIALKVLNPDTAARQPAMLERFRREARSAAKLNHENIVRVFDHGEASGVHYLAMEFVDGIDLHDYVKSKGPLDPEEARQIVLQGARAVAHANELRIVHRDIKPSNFLLVRRHGRPYIKLTDFGLAREVDSEEFRVTRAGTTVGTVDYMAPEQARDSSASDVRSDMFSLGTTWYHLLTGHAPFPDGGLGERLIKIMTEVPPDIREINPRVSDETWAVLSKLLEKDPDDRFQTPEELVEALVALEGYATARPQTKKKSVRKKQPRKVREKEDTRAEAPRTKVEEPPPLPPSVIPYIVGSAIAALVIIGLVMVFAWPKKPTIKDDVSTDPPETPVIVQQDTDKDKSAIDKNKVPDPPRDKDKVVVEPKDKDKTLVERDKDKTQVKQPIVKASLPVLYPGMQKVDAKALREEVEKQFAPRLVTGEPFVARVARAGVNSHRSLADAIAASPADRAIIIEIHDNGPLFELPIRVEGRRLRIKAGSGFRPLIVWDIQATTASKTRKKTDPLVWLTAGKADVSLEGLELAVRRGPNDPEPATFLDISEGELSVSDCTISAAGEPRDPVTFARCGGQRCRFTNIHARGNKLTALELTASAGDVLFDGCLINSGRVPTIRVRGESGKGPNVNLVRSTLLGQSLVELNSANKGDPTPTLKVLAWDCLLSRSGAEDVGDLLALSEGSEPRNVSWRAVNSLYLGWKNLLGGSKPIANIGDWQIQWTRTEGDDAQPGSWPEQAIGELATRPLSVYATTKQVNFASTVDWARPLGCDLSMLSAVRDWLNLALDPSVTNVELPEGGREPEIPNSNDGNYHGGTFNLATGDLGKFLQDQLKVTKPGPKIVMHLTGKGDSSCSPIVLKGTSLVLYFTPPADDQTPRTMLKLNTQNPQAVLIDVTGGNVEVIGGGLKLADELGKNLARGAHLIRVKGGDVRLSKTRLEGPHLTAPESWLSAISMTGAGDVPADKAHICAINESVIVSGKAGMVLDGSGIRARVQQSVVCAGGDALVVRPGAGCKGRTNIQCVLDHATLAGRESVVRLGDVRGAGVPTEPVVLKTTNCTLLNPFSPGKPAVLLGEGEAVARGLLVWWSELDVLDQRLNSMARQMGEPVPERREPLAVWQRLWGSQGAKDAREVGFMSSFEVKRWQLERLSAKGTQAGADFRLLGLVR